MNTGQPVEAAITRIRRIRWDSDPTRTDLHVVLLREYLRRAALWAEALGSTDQWPFFDIAALAAPAERLPDTIMADLEAYLASQHLFGPIKRTCLWSVEWAAAQCSPIMAEYGLPAPYEPLLVMYEAGGEFSMEHGYFDFIGGGFPVGKWSQYRSLETQAVSDQAVPSAV